MTLSDSRPARWQNQRWSRSSGRSGSPPITRSVFPTCRAHYPGGPERVHLSIASPSHAAFPHRQQGRRPRQKCFEACSGFTALRPAGSLSHPRRPLSRGFDGASCPTTPLVSYQINRQLSGWILPPLTLRAFGAHCLSPSFRQRQISRGEKWIRHRAADDGSHGQRCV
jgi:hypothetical protein